MIELGKDENVLLRVRRHWFVFFGRAFSLGLIALLPIAAFIAAYQVPFLEALFGEAHAAALIVFAVAAWLLVVWMILAVSFADYYLDVFVITGERIIDIEQKGLFSRDIATIPIRNIQDIKIETLGIISTMLGFGNLHIQTAGFNKEVVIRGIAHPERVKDKLLELHLMPQESPHRT